MVSPLGTVVLIRSREVSLKRGASGTEDNDHGSKGVSLMSEC